MCTGIENQGTQRLADLKSKQESVAAEKADYARLLARGRLSEANYDLLHEELQRRATNIRHDMRRRTSGTQDFLDELAQALTFLSQLVKLCERLDDKESQGFSKVVEK